MTLHQLPPLLGCKPIRAADIEVAAVTEDSRRVAPGSIFVAARGERYDGHEFACDAAEAGAIAILGDRVGLSELCGLPYIRVKNPRTALGVLAHALAGDPSKGMTVIGITGTNGKSSAVVMAQRVLATCGYSAASLGTLGYAVGGDVQVAAHTTPFAEHLAGLLQRAREAGHSHVVMEVSSHGLDQDRVVGVSFDVAAFMNLTQDHLDYHHDMERYRQAKLKLFEMVRGAGCFTVVNRDDPNAEVFITASEVPCITYGSGADCCADSVRTRAEGASFHAVTPWGVVDVEMHLTGKHNVSNALCVIAICGGLGLPVDRIAEGIGSVKCVPGRFEFVDAGQDFEVVVDYAHTEDGLRNVLQVAREICDGRIITLFGCGGDRDRSKRPKMGATAAALADFTIITSDNPRTEDPERIILDIETGLQRAMKRKGDDYLLIVDREEAIRRAIAMARSGDLVMIAGKGHEDYQILGAKRIHFNDREVACAALEK